MGKKTTKSKHLAYILRHNPASAGINLDPEGWADVTPVLQHLGITYADLKEIVDTDAKGRYTIQDNRIRANQGHSLKDVMAVDLTPVLPPSILYHGTSDLSWEKIQESGGLVKMNRHHVHMTADQTTAVAVARRWKGTSPVVLKIHACLMFADGYDFFVSDNNVWLTDRVPLEYILQLEQKDVL